MPNPTRHSMQWHSFWSTAAMCFLAIAISQALGQAPANHTEARATSEYEIEELPLRPLAISNSGWVAGATQDQHAATWQRKSGLHRIALPAELNFSEATSINSRGEAVGTATSADSSRRTAFLFYENKVTLLPGAQSRASAINDAGEIVGQAIPAGEKVVAPVLWKDGSLINLHICCAAFGRAINAGGTVAGDIYGKEGRYHAFLWDAANGVHIVTLPGEQFSSALALNDHGDLLVKATPSGVFLYANGEPHALEMPKATPRAMNNTGIIVGSFGPGPEEQRAFVWDKDRGLRDLNALIPANSGWALEGATGVNDRGEIVGWGDRDGEQNAGFLLHPREHETGKHVPGATADHSPQK